MLNLKLTAHVQQRTTFVNCFSSSMIMRFTKIHNMVRAIFIYLFFYLFMLWCHCFYIWNQKCSIQYPVIHNYYTAWFSLIRLFFFSQVWQNYLFVRKFNFFRALCDFSCNVQSLYSLPYEHIVFNDNVCWLLTFFQDSLCRCSARF
jgi:hypothetical protein